MRSFILFIAIVCVTGSPIQGQTPDYSHLQKVIDKKIDEIESKTIRWRRHFHQNPELSNQEFKTSKLIAEHLTSLGLEVKTGIAKTGVTGLLTGGKPGPVIAIRADMDALPVKEKVDLPFASKITASRRRSI